MEDRVFKYKAKNPDDSDYHVPHICEKGCWWIDRKLPAKEKAKKTMKQLFDLAAIASAKGIAFGRSGAGDKSNEDAGAYSVILPVDEDTMGAGHGSGGTVLEKPPTVVAMRG